MAEIEGVPPDPIGLGEHIASGEGLKIQGPPDGMEPGPWGKPTLGGVGYWYVCGVVSAGLGDRVKAEHEATDVDREVVAGSLRR